MKEKWVKPKTEVQKFEANEYIAACFILACDYTAANNVEKNTYPELFTA